MAALNLTAELTPAFYALLECAETIAEQHGPDRAEEWARTVLVADIELFCRIGSDRRPALRLIDGGRSGPTQPAA